MNVTRFQAGIVATVLAGAVMGLVWQRQAISELREAQALLREQAAKVATGNGSTAKESAESATAKLRSEMTAPPARTVLQDSNARSLSFVAPSASRALPPVATSATAEQRAGLHRQYDGFFQQRGLTAAGGDRIVELLLLQGEARRDLQESVNAQGLRGDTPGIETLRSKLYAPIQQEMREILGSDGYAEYQEYSKYSYYRMAIVDPLRAVMNRVNAPLSSGDSEMLVRLLASNDHPVKLRPTDIGNESRIDWSTVLFQAGTTLTPEQKKVIQAFAQEREAKRGP